MFQLVQNPKVSFVSQSMWSVRRATRAFQTEFVSRNKATLRNISATTNKQKTLWVTIGVFLPSYS